MRLLALPLLLILLPACRNACQSTCARMARYAEQDCGLVVPRGEIASCEAAMARPSREDRRTCRQSGDLGTIRELWSCDDMADYVAAPNDPTPDGGHEAPDTARGADSGGEPPDAL